MSKVNLSRIATFLALMATLVWSSLAWAQDQNQTQSQSFDQDQSYHHDSITRILVTSDGLQDGRVIDAYIIKNTKNFGVFTNTPLKDLPFTVNVVGEDFMNNLGTMTPRDVFRRIPGIEDNAHSEINGFSYFRARGIQTTGTNNLALNGVPTGNIGAVMFTEDLGSIEVFSGPSSFMYGIGNVGGMANFNTKRPLWEYATKIRYGTYNNGSLFAHADIGGPIITDKLAFRLNLLVQNGKTAIKPQSLDRKLISGALDWRISDDLLIQFYASYGEHFQQGRQGAFTAEWDNPKGALVIDAPNNTADYRTFLPFIPDPPDPEKLWVSKDTFNDYKIYLIGANLRYKINDQLSVRAALLNNRWKRKTLMTINFFTPDPDIYIYGVSPLIWDRKHTGGYFYFDGNFNTGPVEHKLTLGFNGYFKEEIGIGSGGSYMVWYRPSFSLANAVNNNLNSLNLFARLAPMYKQSDTLNYNVILADEIKFNDQWQLFAGISRVSYQLRGFNAAGATTSDFTRSGFTPSVALVFKPKPWLSTYASYIETLESAGVAGATYANAGEVMPPMVSKQYEIGAKASYGDLYFTLALYQIERASTMVENNTLTLGGRTRHKGIELSAQTRLFESLNLYGGITFNDAKVIKHTTRSYIGKDPVDAPKITAKLYAEYDLPFLQGLTLTGSINHYGAVYTNSINNLKIPGHTIGDLGFRYAANILGQDMAFRFNVQNVTNERYWYGGSGSHLVVGQPRSFSFIGEVNF
ncbi:MAG: TonB-dependent receptor [Deltaproteobacteria bacterium]|jgi:iron complex outermembrane receptor protein|nr:TonB-dependent receptor [Deltaproteobacteria bacterium]